MTTRESQFTTILTDVGGVLIQNYDATIDDVRRSVKLPETVFQTVWKEAVRQYGTDGDEAVFWRAFSTQGGVAIEPDGSLFKKGFEVNLHVYQRVIELLVRSGKTLSVLSNTIPPHSEVLSAHGVYDAFDRNNVFLSHEIHERKPDEGAYLFALKQLEVDPHEVLFIDDIESNLVIPRQIGMRTLLAAGGEDMIAASLASTLSIDR